MEMTLPEMMALIEASGDECWDVYVGGREGVALYPIKLTPEGEEYYKPLLEHYFTVGKEAASINGKMITSLMIIGRYEYSDVYLGALEEFLYDAAGYCSKEDFNKMFKDEES